MAVSGRYISCKRAIDRVYQDAGLEVNIEEAIEWVGDVLDFIGSPLLLKTIVTNGLADEDGIVYSPVPIVSYRAAIPLNLHEIKMVADYESKQMLYEITDPLYKSYGSLDYPNLLEETSYIANNNYIFTGYETGFLELAYTAYALDTEGFPLVPDDTRVTRALTTYIARNIDYRNWRAGRLSGDVFKYSDREYLFAVASASNKVAIPSIDRMDSWMRARIQLMPRLKLHQTAFRHPLTTNIQLHPQNLNDRVRVIGDAQSVILNLTLYGVTVSNSTNLVLYWNFTNSGTTRLINFYSTAAKTAGVLVAHATGAVLNGNVLNVAVTADNTSGISGNVTINISSSGVIDDTDSSNMVVLINPV